MKFLWMTWKDLSHPLAGGAEVINEEIAKRLTRDGHEVVFLVGGFAGGVSKEIRDGYTIFRLGNRWNVYWKAYRAYKKQFQGWADVIIDEMNTIPFFCHFYVNEPHVLFAHQLCREIWFYQMPFPLNFIGYVLEPLYLRLLSSQKALTVSKSSQIDLKKYGFTDIGVIQNGCDVDPIASLDIDDKFSEPTVLSLGSMRAMKRTLHQLRAFELAKKKKFLR